MAKTRTAFKLTSSLLADGRPVLDGRIERWALLVGISKYAQKDLSLKYAARDARSLRDVLLQPTAGAFAEDHVLMLVDAEASLAGLNKALRTFLKRPAANDLVVLFFACHGSFDPERPGNLYLLPHDADLQDVSGTGLPMREIDTALRETLHSQRVVVLMDSCHSGGVDGRFSGLRARGAEAQDLNQYLNALAESRGGVSLMTSAMANESSIESQAWGRGHGVFTHFLLEGLKGKADREPRDGIVTVGELFDYVTEQVKQATDGRQHPHIGAAADRKLPLAVMAASNAEQHLELAAVLGDAAQLTNEPVCWLGAAQQFEQAIRLGAADEDVELVMETACAWTQGGDLERAWTLLDALPRDAPQVRARLGMVELALGRLDDARSTLLLPEPTAPWAAALFELTTHPQRRVALLVALDRVAPERYSGWEGELKCPVAETRAFGELLEKEFGFDEIVWLLDQHATASALHQALTDLVARSESFGAFVVMLSGHGGVVEDSATPRGRDGTFVAFDEQVASRAVDALLRRSRATRTTLIASTSHSGYFAANAASGGYEAMVSCGASQVDMDGDRYGVFVEALFEHLRPTSDPRVLPRRVADSIKRMNHSQQPEFVLHLDEPPIAGPRVGVSSVPGAAMASALLGRSDAASDDALAGALAFAAANDASAAWCAGALASAAQRTGLTPQLAQWLTPLSTGGDAAACVAVLQTAQRMAAPAVLGTALDSLAPRAIRLKRPKLRGALKSAAQDVRNGGGFAERTEALLVGLNESGSQRGGGRSPADNVSAVEAALLAAGVPTKGIVKLLDADASASAVRATLDHMARGKSSRSLLIYWFGPGEGDTLICRDAGLLSLTDLAGATDRQPTLLIDGCDITRTSRGAGDAAPSMHLIGRERDAKGRLSASPWRPRLDGRPGKARYAPVALAFVEALRLRASNLGALRTLDVINAGGCSLLQARAGQDLLLADRMADQVGSLIAELRNAIVDHAASRSEEFLALRGGGDGPLQLQLGVLLASLGRHDAAIAALERAVPLLASDKHLLARARLMLGRTLLASGHDRARAVSECRIASELDPHHPDALFWLGRAIAELIQRETVSQANNALTTYLTQGARGGRRAETMQLLDALAGTSMRLP